MAFFLLFHVRKMKQRQGFCQVYQIVKMSCFQLSLVMIDQVGTKAAKYKISFFLFLGTFSLLSSADISLLSRVITHSGWVLLYGSCL